ncbi:MAG: SIS domain-containing protein, partial [Clostridia bacterium]|nr:SIS domain-containing protein [Clostridia bacterium]
MINLEKEIREQPQALANVVENNLPVIRALVAKAKEKGVKNIYFAARGTSDHACVYAQYLFGIFAGIPCTLGTPSVFTKYGAHVDLSDNLVIGVSQSGKAEDVLAVLESAKADGAITAAVTNNPDSPMAGCAEYHLFCGCGHEASIAATKTFTTQMTILGAIAAVWAENDDLLAALSSIGPKAQEMLDTK